MTDERQTGQPHDSADASVESAAAAPPEFADIGEQLRAAREAAGLSEQEVAAQLNLTRRVIVALEAEDFEALPGRAFARGYLRSYARQVGISDEALEPALEALRDPPEAGPKPVSTLAPSSSNVLDTGPSRIMIGVAVALLVLVVVLVVGALLWSGGDGLELPVEETSEGDEGADDITTVIGEPVAAAGSAPETVVPGSDQASSVSHLQPAPLPLVRPVSVPAITLRSAPQALAESSAGNSTEARDALTPVADSGPTAGVTVERERTAADNLRLLVRAGGNDHLTFRFRRDSWVEVWDARDRELHRDLRRAEQELEVWGQAPFRILLGYAPAVSLRYNDERVALEPYIRNDVASLVLDR